MNNKSMYLLFCIATSSLISCVEQGIQPIEITIIKNGIFSDKPSDKLPEFICKLFEPLENSDLVYISGINKQDGYLGTDCFQPEIYIRRTDFQNDSLYKIVLPREAANEIRFIFGTYTFENIKEDFQELLPTLKAGDYLSKNGIKSNNTAANLLEYDYLFSKKYAKNNDKKKFNNIDSLRQSILQTILETGKVKYVICYECGPSCTGELGQLEKNVNNIIQSFKTFDRCGWDGPKPQKNLSKEYINIYKEIKPYKEKSEILFTRIKKLNEENNPQVCDTITELKKVIDLFNTKYFAVMKRICPESKATENSVVEKNCMPSTIRLEFDKENGQLYCSNYEGSNTYFFQIATDKTFGSLIKEGNIDARNNELRFPLTNIDYNIIKEILGNPKVKSTRYYRFKVICRNKDHTDYSNSFELSESCNNKDVCTLSLQ